MNGDVTVREAMTRDYVGVSESDPLDETAMVLLEADVPGAIVLRGQEPIGMLTARDVLAWVANGDDAESATVADCMSTELPTISPDATLSKATDELFARSATQLVVTDTTGEPVGMLTQRDVVAAGTISPTEETRDHDVEQSRVDPSETIEADGEGTFNDQGICERCGALASDLVSFNGQLLCADCRDV
jgi:CBS domain-containing protein